MSGFDWPALMRAGLVGLRLQPGEFWALTPAELRLMLDQAGPARALNRQGLEVLLKDYPDREKGCDDGRERGD